MLVHSSKTDSGFIASIFLSVVSLTAISSCDLATPKASEQQAANEPEAISKGRLTVGSSAPFLDIAHWIQTGNGKFRPVKKFENGKVYVVEFWATWCQPCIQSMPHLVDLQKKYDDGEVQIISVSDEPLDEVKEFLAREAGQSDGKPVTFQELTSAYCLTTDPDESTSQAYPRAAEIPGIPVAFIVGKDRRIEWIGHPMEMDEPLDKVVNDRWNRDEFAEQYEEEKDFEGLGGKIESLLATSGDKEPTAGNVDSAIKLVKDFVAKARLKQTAAGARFTLLDIYTRFRPNDKELLPVARDVFKDFASRPMTLHTLAWGLYELSENGQIDNKELIEEALAATQASLATVEPSQRGTVLDTIAHLHEHLGDLPAALKSAREAADAPDASSESKKYVEELEQRIENNAKQ